MSEKIPIWVDCTPGPHDLGFQRPNVACSRRFIRRCRNGPAGPGVTTGFISRVYLELGVRLTTANVSSELAGRAKKYVLADAVRRKGAAVNYKISRVGRAFIEAKRDA